MKLVKESNNVKQNKYIIRSRKRNEDIRIVIGGERLIVKENIK